MMNAHILILIDPNVMSDQKNQITASDAYGEAARIYTYFVDWRNKMLVRYSIFSGAIIFMAKLLSEVQSSQVDRNVVVSLLMLIAAFGALMTWQMDVRNRNLTRDAAKACRDIEKNSDVRGFYSTYEENREGSVTYHAIFSALYLVSAAALLLLALYFIFVRPFA